MSVASLLFAPLFRTLTLSNAFPVYTVFVHMDMAMAMAMARNHMTAWDILYLCDLEKKKKIERKETTRNIFSYCLHLRLDVRDRHVDLDLDLTVCVCACLYLSQVIHVLIPFSFFNSMHEKQCLSRLYPFLPPFPFPFSPVLADTDDTETGDVRIT
jgi:hypothetical protein